MSTAGALKKRDRRRTIDKSTMCRDRILFCQNRLWSGSSRGHNSPAPCCENKQRGREPWKQNTSTAGTFLLTRATSGKAPGRADSGARMRGCLLYTSGLISPIYLINNETGKVATSTFAAAVINIVVDLALVKFIGMYAAPISSLCAYLVISLWRLWDVEKRYLKIPFGKAFLIASVTAFAIVTAGYYSKILLIQIICSVFACLFAVLFNRKLLISMLKAIKVKRGK